MKENKKFYQVVIPVQKAKEIGFKAVEEEAKQRLKAMYPKEKWRGAIIVGDVVGNSVVFTIEGATK